MIKSGVPTGPEGLQEWMETEVISGMRDILAEYNHDQVIGHSNLAAVREKAKEFFLNPTGLFAKSGICGNDTTSFTEGTGEVIIRVDTVNPTQKLQDAMESPVVATYESEAAKKKADIEKTLAGDPIRLAMQEWVESQKEAKETVARATKRLIASGAYAAHERTVKDIILARSGNLQVSRTEFGSPDGTPLPHSLQYLSIGGGGGGGVLFGGKGQKQNNSNKKGGAEVTNFSSDDPTDAAERYFKRHEKYPPWDPLKREPK